MKPQLFLTSVIRPGLAVLADATALRVDSPEAEVLLLAIATQESALRHRTQVGGPARGYWQFERGGGLAGIMVAGFFLVLAWLLSEGMPAQGGEALLVLLGALSSGVAAVLSYYFGSSSGSAWKSKLLAEERDRP